MSFITSHIVEILLIVVIAIYLYINAMRYFRLLLSIMSILLFSSCLFVFFAIDVDNDSRAYSVQMLSMVAMLFFVSRVFVRLNSQNKSINRDKYSKEKYGKPSCTIVFVIAIIVITKIVVDIFL